MAPGPVENGAAAAVKVTPSAYIGGSPRRVVGQESWCRPSLGDPSHGQGGGARPDVIAE